MNDNKAIEIFNAKMEQIKNDFTDEKCEACHIGNFEFKYEPAVEIYEGHKNVVDDYEIEDICFFNHCPDCGTKLNLKIHAGKANYDGCFGRFYFTHEKTKNDKPTSSEDFSRNYFGIGGI